MAKTETAYLVVRSDREMRIVRRPRLAPDEVAIRLSINFPDSWGRVIGDLEINLPDAPVTVDLAMDDEAV